jgi:putative DNA-invertase from lambdoid prophage Rac
MSAETLEHQLAHARSAGFTIEEVVSDNGVSGLSTRLVERPEGRGWCLDLNFGPIAGLA